MSKKKVQSDVEPISVYRKQAKEIARDLHYDKYMPGILAELDKATTNDRICCLMTQGRKAWISST